MRTFSQGFKIIIKVMSTYENFTNENKTHFNYNIAVQIYCNTDYTYSKVSTVSDRRGHSPSFYIL